MDKKKPTKPIRDSAWVHVGDVENVRYWAKYFGVEIPLLRQAVREVGPNILHVRKWLSQPRRVDD
jgi:Protein of unknown function (DUF3606)